MAFDGKVDVPWLAGVRVFRHAPGDPPDGRCLVGQLTLASAVDWSLSKAGCHVDQLEIRIDDSDDSFAGADIVELSHLPLRPRHC